MRSTSGAPERILAFGLYGSGKTNAWATIAESYRATNTPGTFYVVNTELGAIDRLADAYEAFDMNVQWTDVYDWNTLADATDSYQKRAVAGDWIIIEGVDKAWTWIRNLWDETAMRKRGQVVDRSDPFATVEADDDRSKWDPINGAYNGWILPLINPRTNPAHLFATAPQQALKMPTGKQGEWVDDASVRSAFGSRGVRPEGQKFLGHQFFSVLHMEHPKAGKWTMSTVDDHAREHVSDVDVGNFTMGYLVKVGRWEM